MTVPISRPKKKVTAAWRKILMGPPGYDPFAQAREAWFDPVRAEEAITRFETCIRHVEGKSAGKPFILEPWEKAIVANLFGWVEYNANGDVVRRFREVFIYVPRKNGKTAFAAALVVVLFFFDGEAGGQFISAAADRDQAALIFRQAKGMIARAPALEKRCKILDSFKSIYLLSDPASTYKAVSAEAYTKHGLNVHVAAVDELHAQPNRELVDTLVTAMGFRTQPLTIYTTTADYLRESICNEVYDYACRVRDNSIDPALGVNSSRMLPVIFDAMPDEDWTDKKIWARVNPNLGVTITLDFLEAECAKAQAVPAYENTFRRLYLNQRTQQDQRAIPMDQWIECGLGVEPVAWRNEMLAKLKGRPCLGGLDIGSTNDLTSLVLYFHKEPPPIPVLCWFWTTEAAVERRRRERVEYDTWVRQGFMALTEGNETDYAKVQGDIDKIGDDYGILEIAADRMFQGGQLLQELGKLGFNIIAYPQSFIGMASPTKRILEEIIPKKQIHHGNNPVLTWMAGNAATTEKDGLLKFSKDKSTEKIDGIVSLAMIVGRADVSTEAAPAIEIW